MSLEKSFDEINKTDIRQLIENQIAEPKNIEYKLVLPENKYDSKKEFLPDVSSFANTVGGTLFTESKKKTGYLLRYLVCLTMTLGEIARLENLLRDNIQPRIQGISTRAIN